MKHNRSIRLFAVAMLLVLLFSALAPVVACAEGPIKEGKYESVAKTNYGYLYTLNAQQAEQFARDSYCFTGTRSELALMLLNPWFGLGYSIPRWMGLMPTAGEVRAANSAGRGIYLGVATCGNWVVAMLVKAR